MTIQSKLICGNVESWLRLDRRVWGYGDLVRIETFPATVGLTVRQGKGFGWQIALIFCYFFIKPACRRAVCATAGREKVGKKFETSYNSKA